MSAAGRPRDFSALFDPASVAILGASNDESKYGNWLSVQALTMLDRRRVHLVNRRGESVLGRPPVRSLTELPEPVDLVAITVPAAGFEEAVEDALAAGARAIVGVTSGFAELGAAGRAAQERIVARVREAGALLVGPNCLGALDTTTGLALASNPLPAGRVALLSQSGNMALELSGFLKERGLGFSRFVSLGNQADVSAAELIAECVDHDGTDLIAVYCEDFGDGRAFVDAAARANRAGKPVLLLTVGGSEASIRGARSHTGALTSAIAVVDAACAQAGILRLESPRELADAALALSACRVETPPRRIAVIADGGGHAGVASDSVERAGLSVPRFSDALASRLAGMLPPSASVTNPIDVAGAGEQDIRIFPRLLATMLDSDEVDAVVLTGYFGGYGAYGDELAAEELRAAERMAEHAARAGRPVLTHTMAHASAAAGVLRAGGIPVFEAVEDAARAMAVLGRARRPDAPELVAVAAEPVTDDDYLTARRLLGAAGVPFLGAERAADAGQALAAAERVGYPVALKALGLVHKSDAGGVALGLAGPAELTAAFERMHAALAAPGYAVERMADLSSRVELIVGAGRDPRFGAVVMAGIGGVFTEVLGDVAFALAPVSHERALELLRSLRAAALLDGVRGRPPVDLDAAAAAIVAVSRFAAAHPEVAELEVNPLAAGEDGVVGLDARILLA